MDNLLNTQQLINNIEQDIHFLKTNPTLFITTNRYQEILETLQKTYDYLKSIQQKETHNEHQ